jgi:Ribosomal protein S3AE
MSKSSKKAPVYVYNVHANSVFKDKVIAQILGKTPDSILKRTVETTLADLLDDQNNIYFQYIKLKFQIIKVDGYEAYSKFKGHEMTRDYVRSLVRPGTSRVDTFYDVYTTDNIHCRLQALAITAKHVGHSVESEIRKAVTKKFEELLSNVSLDELISKTFLGNVSAELNAAAKKIYPLKKFELIKSKVLTKYIS